MALWSTYRHTDDRKNLRFHLLTTEPGAQVFARMLKLAERWGMRLSIEEATTESIKHLPATERLPIYTYLRLLIPGILKGVKRFLYLDSDLLIRSSVRPLFDTMPENAAASGARDYYYFILETGLPHTFSELGVPPNQPYINCGVMMMNAAVWRDREISQRALTYLDDHASTNLHGDQDALNALLVGQINELDLSWNVQTGAIDYFDRVGWPPEREKLRARKSELLTQARIAHFIGPSKPWNDGFRIPYSGEYRSLLVESGWIPGHMIVPWRIGWLASTIRATIKRRMAR